MIYIILDIILTPFLHKLVFLFRVFLVLYAYILAQP